MTQKIALLTLSVLAAGLLNAERFVTQHGEAAVAGGPAMGVTVTQAPAGTLVSVDVLGSTIVETGAAVAVGDTVASDAQGRAVPWAAGNARLGIAVQAASAAGLRIEVLLTLGAA